LPAVLPNKHKSPFLERYILFYYLHLCVEDAVLKQGREVKVRRAGADSFGCRRCRSVWGISLKLRKFKVFLVMVSIKLRCSFGFK